MVFVNKFDRIRDQLSTMALVVPVLQELLMEESMFALKENAVKFVYIKGLARNDPTMGE